MTKATKTPSAIQTHWLTWCLRIGTAMTFIGHGFWGVYNGGKQGWMPFFEYLFGVFHSVTGIEIPLDAAWILMPVVGIVDIALGIAVLTFRPRRGLLLYMAFWAVFTAWLRPAIGVGAYYSQFFERFYNMFGAIALLAIYCGPAYGRVKERLRTFKGSMQLLFEGVEPKPVPESSKRTVLVMARIAVAASLVGHAMYCLIDHMPQLIHHLGGIGLGEEHLLTMGIVNLVMAGLVLFTRSKGVLLTILAVKVGIEMLDPIAGPFFWDIFEVIERMGVAGLIAAIIHLRHMGQAPAPEADEQLAPSPA